MRDKRILNMTAAAAAAIHHYIIKVSIQCIFVIIKLFGSTGKMIVECIFCEVAAASSSSNQQGRSSFEMHQ